MHLVRVILDKFSFAFGPTLTFAFIEESEILEDRNYFMGLFLAPA